MPKPLEHAGYPFYTPPIDAVPVASVSGLQGLATEANGTVRARSSVVEHYVDIVGVTSSNLVVPTICFCRKAG